METSNNTVANLKAIEKIARRSTPLFFMSIAHLFDSGMSRFTEEALALTMQHLEEKHRQAEQEGKILAMTLDYEKDLVNTSYALAKFPLFDLLLYIKKHMEIHDPEKMHPEALTNTYTCETIGEIDGDIVRTRIGSYRVGPDDLEWLIHEAQKCRSFSAMDVKSVGSPIYTD